ncbi:hypothetical protein [Larkinella sp. C7]|uniref:hypothetical protein n=1 Tax=Larkinella sp. C7 TaxID=2576607 RepID=UPI0011112322|nr:hypothetical protein [Larkinella sp. C7]
MGKKVADATVNDLNALLNGIIALIGIKVSAEDKPEHLKTVLTVLKWIQSQYATWTIEEIKLAYELLVSRKLGIEVYRAIDPNYFSDVMAAYLRFRQGNVELQRVYRDQLLLPESTPKEPDQDEAEKWMEFTLKRAVETVKHGGQYQDLGNALYDWLDSKGKIQMSKEQKIGFWNRAIDEITWDIANNQGKNKTLHETERTKQIRDLASLINGMLTPTASNRVLTYAKVLALNHYLVSLIPESDFVVVVSSLKSTPSL